MVYRSAGPVGRIPRRRGVGGTRPWTGAGLVEEPTRGREDHRAQGTRDFVETAPGHGSLFSRLFLT